MTADKLIEGIQILEKYRNKPGGYNIGADHNVIYCYAPPKRISDEDVQRLIELGWFQGNVEHEEDDFEAKHYDEEESWWAFV